MADVVTGVVKRISGSYFTGPAGAAIGSGKWVYWDSATSSYKLCQNDTTSAEAKVKGITLNSAQLGEELQIQGEGEVDTGAELVEGQLYVLSATAGGFAKIDDYVGVSGTGKRPSLVGMGKSNGNLEILIKNVATALP
jgi:hypothetical protein